MDTTRRDFLKSAALGTVVAGSLGVAGAMVGCSSEPAEASAVEKRYEVDVVIAGAGTGGLSCALTALQDGASVVLLEASRQLGGTSRMAVGTMGMRFGNDYENTMKMAPLSDPVKSKIVMDNWAEYKDWIAANGFYTEDHLPKNPGTYLWLGGKKAEPYVLKADCCAYYDAFGEAITAAGGTILTETKAKKLLTDIDGNVIGIRCFDANGDFDIMAKSVVLATGGFQNNKEMMTRYCGVEADCSFPQCVPYLDGAGIRMAEAIGARMSSGTATFYGHHQSYPWALADDAKNPEKYEDMDIELVHSMYLGSAASGFQDRGIICNLEGKRYFDESQESFLINQYTCKQKHACGYIIIDQGVRDGLKGWRSMNGCTSEERIDWLEKNGAPVLKADTIDELADKIVELTTSAEKFNKNNFLKTFNEYNAAVDAGTVDQLEIPKHNPNSIFKLDNPPYYCFPVVAGIMGTFGGLDITNEGEVINTLGDTIPNLYAVPGCAGGIMHTEYWCVISGYSIFGRLIGHEAASHAAAATA